MKKFIHLFHPLGIRKILIRLFENPGYTDLHCRARFHRHEEMLIK